MNDNTYRDASKIGQRIHEERKSLDLSMQKMGEYVYTTRQSIAKWETGDLSTMEVRHLLRMCELFECESGYLLCEYDCKHKEIDNIQRVIGLSEDAIHKLALYNSGDDFHAKVSKYCDRVSSLVESLDFGKLLSCLSVAIGDNNAGNKVEDCCYTGKDVREATRLLEECGMVCLSVEEVKELYLQKTTDIFNNIVRKLQDQED